VFGDLGKALANVSLQLCIWVRDKGGKIRNCTLVDNGLGELFGVLGNLSKGGGRDSL